MAGIIVGLLVRIGPQGTVMVRRGSVNTEKVAEEFISADHYRGPGNGLVWSLAVQVARMDRIGSAPGPVGLMTGGVK
jgi:hypothetical protein